MAPSPLVPADAAVSLTELSHCFPSRPGAQPPCTFQDIHPPLAKLVFAVVLMLRGFVGAEEERVVWWGKDGFVGTKDWMLLYVENGQPGIVHPHPHTLSLSLSVLLECSCMRIHARV